MPGPDQTSRSDAYRSVVGSTVLSICQTTAAAEARNRVPRTKLIAIPLRWVSERPDARELCQGCGTSDADREHARPDILEAKRGREA